MTDIVNFIFSAGFLCIPLNIFYLSVEIQLSCLEMVCDFFKVCFLSFVSGDESIL